jgi:hypothetical protein
MDSYLTQPLPLITPRIEFAFQSVAHLPVITARMDFTTLGLKMPNGNAHATPVNDNESDIEVDNSTSDIEMDDLPLAASSLTHNQTNDDFSSLSESENNNQRQKIRKPVGEPGRPKSGGYTLEKEIASWGSDTIAKVNVSLFVFKSLGMFNPLIGICPKSRRQVACDYTELPKPGTSQSQKNLY